MRKRIRYSQNFLKDHRLVNQLLSRSSIRKKDLVYEIGAGDGIITTELLRSGATVVAYEIDANLAQKLSEKFANNPEIQIKNEDFINSSLPRGEYKVFSNIPFNITADVIRRLMFNSSSPLDTYLIMQKEAAKKFIGKPFAKRNSMQSVLIKSRFESSIFHEFNRSDFFPVPNVDIVMVRFKKQETPRVEAADQELFNDFVAYLFSQFEPTLFKSLKKILSDSALMKFIKTNRIDLRVRPSELDFESWVMLFHRFKGSPNLMKIKGTFKNLDQAQGKLQKDHRTRQALRKEAEWNKDNS